MSLIGLVSSNICRWGKPGDTSFPPASLQPLKTRNRTTSQSLTLSLYDEAQVALRSRIEKERSCTVWGTFRNVSTGNSIGISDGLLTIYLIYNPTKQGYITAEASFRACGLRSAGHCKAMAISLPIHANMALCLYLGHSRCFMDNWEWFEMLEVPYGVLFCKQSH